jgi:hypothetical protein
LIPVSNIKKDIVSESIPRFNYLSNWFDNADISLAVYPIGFLYGIQPHIDACSGFKLAAPFTQNAIKLQWHGKTMPFIGIVVRPIKVGYSGTIAEN